MGKISPPRQITSTIRIGSGNASHSSVLSNVGFATRAHLEAANVSDDVDAVYVRGHTTEGVGGGWYHRIATPSPVKAWHVQSDDEAWWQLAKEATNHPAQFGPCDSVANTTIALQAAVDFGDGVLDLNGDTLSFTTVTITNNVTLQNGSLISTLTASGSISILVERDKKLTLRWMDVSAGGANNTYVADQFIIYHSGTVVTSPSVVVTRAAGLEIDNCLIHGSGSYGILGNFDDNVRITNTSFFNIAYAATMLVSCDDFYVTGNTFNMLGAVGDGSGNAYGFSSTHTNTSAPGDENPFCRRGKVMYNKFIGPDIWQALDSHGGDWLQYNFNQVFAAKFGVAISSSSGAATNYAGSNNQIIGNLIDSRLPDGTASGVSGVYGVSLTGGSSQAQTNSIAANNTIIGYGSATAGSQAIRLTPYVQDSTVSGNLIYNWRTYGIYTDTTCTGNSIVNNVFSTPSAAGAECINYTGGGATRCIISGNIARGTPSIGLRLTAGASSVVTYGVNQFDTASDPTVISGGVTLFGHGIAGYILQSGVSGAVTIDLAFTKAAPTIPITINFDGLVANVTSVDLNNFANGQVFILHNNDASFTVTYTRAEAALDGSASVVLARDDTLMLVGLGTSLRQVGKAPTNG